jgi:dTDP-4-amino-4,6-dideoxygalactose transaminase
VGAWNGVEAVATNGWSGAALAALDFAGVKGETVLCPSNTFAATPFAAVRSGAEVQFVDCNKEDLCMSFEDFERKAEQYKPKAAMLVHIGGHIAFDSEKIAAYCAANDIFLFEDCAHAHGADWNGASRVRSVTPAPTRSTRPRPSRPARAGCSFQSGRRSPSTRDCSVTTASRATRSPG